MKKNTDPNSTIFYKDFKLDDPFGVTEPMESPFSINLNFIPYHIGAKYQFPYGIYRYIPQVVGHKLCDFEGQTYMITLNYFNSSNHSNEALTPAQEYLESLDTEKTRKTNR